jgi:hypothetical protein
MCVRSSDNLKDRAILTLCESLVKRRRFSYEKRHLVCLTNLRSTE